MSIPSRLAVSVLVLLLGLPCGRLAAQSKTGLLKAGTKAPDFVSRDVTGRDVRLSDFRGKVVVLDFWATWCGPCIQSLPHVQEVASAQKGSGVVVLAVCTSDSRARYESWMQDHASEYPDVVFTCDPYDRGNEHFDDRASAKLYHVTGLPTKFVIGKDGLVAMTIVGDEDGDVRLEAGLARAGIPVDAEVAKTGEAQAAEAARKEAARAAEAAAHPRPSFRPKLLSLSSGAALPEFSLVGTDGKEFAFTSLRGQPVVVALAWADIVPARKLDAIVKRYGHYGVQVLAAMVFTARTDFQAWALEDEGKHPYLAGVDPVGRYEGDPEHPDPEAQMAFHRGTVVGKLFGGGMYPGMPIGLVVDAEGRFVGSFGFGPDSDDGLGNLLLRAGIALDPEDTPETVVPLEPREIQPRAPAPAPAEAPVERLAVGATAPDFVSQNSVGKPVRLSDFGGKVVVLDFWATWCGPCKAALPHTQEVAARYADQDVVVLANCTSDTRQAFDAWLQQHQGDHADIVFTHDEAGKGADRASRALYGVTGIPQQFVIGKDGKVAAIVDGYVAGEVLLEAALAEAGVEVDGAILEQAAQDQAKRKARAGKTMRAKKLR